jgi:hypothetical protein
MKSKTDKSNIWKDIAVDDLKELQKYQGDAFRKLFLCGFVQDEEPSHYPEIKHRHNYSGIYEHTCYSCERTFYGYKYHRYCLDCKRKGVREEDE